MSYMANKYCIVLYCIVLYCKLQLFLASYMEKVRHLCICYASVIQLAYVALNYVKTVKNNKKIYY